MQFRQLLPAPTSVEVTELLDGLRPAERAHADRPHLAVNFVASADGRATFAGRSGPLGDDGDRAMFHGLREQFDAVLAGMGTLRTERYGRILGKAERRERRVARGLPPEPLAVIVSRSGEIPDIPLLNEPEARVAIYSAMDVDATRWPCAVQVVHLERPQPTLRDVVSHLHAELGVRALLCEGGPTLFGALLQEELVDELFLTIAPKMVGGSEDPGVTAGRDLSDPAPLAIRWLLERNESLFLRYAIG